MCLLFCRLGGHAAWLLAVLLAAGAVPASAQEPAADPDEATGLRVAKSRSGDIELAWQPPGTAPDSYQVRRCALASLAVPHYGNCVAEGLASPSFAEPAPPGDVFYLVSGSFSGSEGSLGRSFDGRLWRDRTAPPCSSPSLPYVMSVDVVLDSAVGICGTQIALAFPAGLATYVAMGSDCAGLMGAGFGVTNATVNPLRHACVLPPGPPAVGPGVVARFSFQIGECPVALGAFTLVQCDLAGCDSNPVAGECSLR